MFTFPSKTLHSRTKNVYNSEITFLALVPWTCLAKLIYIFYRLGRKKKRKLENEEEVQIRPGKP